MAIYFPLRAGVIFKYLKTVSGLNIPVQKMTRQLMAKILQLTWGFGGRLVVTIRRTAFVEFICILFDVKVAFPLRKWPPAPADHNVISIQSYFVMTELITMIFSSYLLDKCCKTVKHQSQILEKNH